MQKLGLFGGLVLVIIIAVAAVMAGRMGETSHAYAKGKVVLTPELTAAAKGIHTLFIIASGPDKPMPLGAFRKTLSSDAEGAAAAAAFVEIKEEELSSSLLSGGGSSASATAATAASSSSSRGARVSQVAALRESFVVEFFFFFFFLSERGVSRSRCFSPIDRRSRTHQKH